MALNKDFVKNITEAINSLTEAEKLNLSNVIYDGVIDVNDFTNYHNVLDGYRDGQKVPIISAKSNYGLMAAKPDGCGINTCDLTNEYSTKVFNIGDYACRIGLCFDELEADFRTFWRMYKQTTNDPSTEPDKKAFLDFVILQAQNAVKATIWRVGYHGDKTSSNVLINQNNGVWVEADGGDGAMYSIKFVNPEGQRGEEIYKKFAEMYAKEGSKKWFKPTEVQWLTTLKTARELVTWLNGLNDLSPYNCSCTDPSKVVSARVFTIDNLSIFGIPVKAYEGEEESEEFLTSGTTSYKALLIKESNLLFAVETKEHLEQFDMFYDKMTKKIYIDLGAQLGAAIPLDEYAYLTEDKTA